VIHPELNGAAQHADRPATVARGGVGHERLAVCVRRIAPKPIRLTSKSPSCQVPDAAALIG